MLSIYVEKNLHSPGAKKCGARGAFCAPRTGGIKYGWGLDGQYAAANAPSVLRDFGRGKDEIAVLYVHGDLFAAQYAAGEYLVGQPVLYAALDHAP